MEYAIVQLGGFFIAIIIISGGLMYIGRGRSKRKAFHDAANQVRNKDD